MKKWMIGVCFALMLTGCAAKETFETVSDEHLQPVMAPVGEVTLSLPESASSQTVQHSDGDKLYFCDGYTVTVQTMDRGDLERTVQTVCGLRASQLEIMETMSQGNKRWDCVGEGGDCVGRAAVIDDGEYHYCVTVMAESALAGSLQNEWNALLDSFSVD